jgi:xylulokinase
VRPADSAATGEVVLGIDIGTTAVKVAAFTPDGVPVRERAIGYALSRPRPGWAEQDPCDWWLCTARGVADVVAGLPVGAVRSVGVVGQVNTHVFVDERLQPLAPAVVWQDQRARAVAAELDARFTPQEKVRLWGAPITLDASFVASCAAWMARNEPDVWTRTRWILSPKDFVAARLTGRVRTDGRTAVRSADRTGERYLPEVVGLVDGLGERLPRLADPASVLGEVTDPDLGIGRPVVAVGTSDTFGDVVGTATVRAGRGMVVCGTSAVVVGVSPRAVPTRGIATFPPRDGLHVHGGPTQAAGDALRWWSETCGASVDEVLSEAAAAPAGSSGVVFTPHLAGERAPLWDADARGSFLGLSRSTSRADLSRAVLEGVAMSARRLLAAVETACDMLLDPVVFAGGGARSELWTRIHADVLGRPVQRLRVPGTAALGAALLGAVAAGVHPSVPAAAAAAVAVERTIEPDPASSGRYDPLFDVSTAAHQALGDVHARLASWRSAWT